MNALVNQLILQKKTIFPFIQIRSIFTMERRKTTINPSFFGRQPSQCGQPPLTPAPPPADNTSLSDEESGEPDSSSVDSIVEGEGKPEPDRKSTRLNSSHRT